MKARIKATGEIVEVRIDYKQDADYIAQNGQLYWQRELDFNIDGGKFAENCLNGIKQGIVHDPDYWTRLEHQYAGMAMQGILACEEWKISPREGVSFAGEVALQAQEIAHALVEKMKEEREG